MVGREEEKALSPRIMIIHLVGHAWYYCCTLCMFHLYYYTRHSHADRQVITLCANEHLSAPLLFIAKMKSTCLSRSLLCTSSLIVLSSQLLNFACEHFKWWDGGALMRAQSCPPLSLEGDLALLITVLRLYGDFLYHIKKKGKMALCKAPVKVEISKIYIYLYI